MPNEGRPLTTGALGTTKLAMNLPIALFWVLLTNPSHRRISKLDMPYMSRVDLSSERVDEVVLDEERVPGVDEINGGYRSRLEGYHPT